MWSLFSSKSFRLYEVDWASHIFGLLIIDKRKQALQDGRSTVPIPHRTFNSERSKTLGVTKQPQSFTSLYFLQKLHELLLTETVVLLPNISW